MHGDMTIWLYISLIHAGPSDRTDRLHMNHNT